MPKEFTYKQRPTDNSKEFERNWDKAFTKDQVKEMSDKSAHYTGETTEQKQPLATNPSTKHMRTEIDNRQEYYQRRFEYFGGEVEWIECVPDILNEMIEPIDKLSLAFRYLNKEAKKFTDSVERITQ